MLTYSVIHRYRWPFRLWRRPRFAVYVLAVLPGTETRGSRSPAYALDGPAAHEVVDVDTCSRTLRRDADNSVRQLGGLFLLVGLGTAVLPNVSQPDPDSYHAPHITHVLHGRCGKRHHRSDHRVHRCRVHSRYAIGPILGITALIQKSPFNLLLFFLVLLWQPWARS